MASLKQKIANLTSALADKFNGLRQHVDTELLDVYGSISDTVQSVEALETETEPVRLYPVIRCVEQGGTYTRPTSRTDVTVIFIGQADPGGEALDYDVWIQVS